MAFIILYVTFPNKEEAKKIADHLIKKKLIACANMFPIDAVFLWKGNVESEDEIVVLFKTTEEKHKVVEEVIKNLHSYDTPCIMRFDVSANKEYEDWVQESID